MEQRFHSTNSFRTELLDSLKKIADNLDEINDSMHEIPKLIDTQNQILERIIPDKKEGNDRIMLLD